MDGSGAVNLDVLQGLSGISRDAWDALANPPGANFDPFISYDFLEACEASGCATAETGWAPAHLIARAADGAAIGAMPLYLKDHSYGEYVFDHAWADALIRAGGNYYPKLQCAAPFTPVPGRRLLTTDPLARAALAEGAIALAQRNRLSSVHVTFAPDEDCASLRALGYLRRAGIQYHWFNQGYKSFADFLAALSSEKRKNIRRERARAAEIATVRRLQGDEIKPLHWDVFYRCYMDTGSRKWGRPYLNRAFFDLISQRMARRIVMFIAEQDGAPIAAALNFLGGDALYGRYWGRLAEAPFLHFELCYYQAIDYAIEHGLARVEAGAQGEHKLARGYVPVATHSAHWIAHPGLRQAVAQFLNAETPAVTEEAEMLADHTPFKKG